MSPILASHAVRQDDQFMSDEVRLVPPEEGDADEAWERLTDEPEIRGVDAAWVEAIGGWQVSAWVLEVIQGEPIEAELRLKVADALADVDGVIDVGEYDQETWFVAGTPRGEALTQAVAQVVDDLADRTRPYGR
jgi:hypothetical protein